MKKKYYSFLLSLLCLVSSCGVNTAQIEGSNNDRNITAEEQEETRSIFNISFLVDGEVYKSINVNKDDIPRVEEPKKEEDEIYRYEFLKWAPDIAPASKNTTYVAVFNKIRKQCKITWIVDGNVTEVYYDKGTMPSYNGEVVKNPEGRKKYVFDGWEPEISKVEEDCVYVAKFRQEERDYKITFISDNKIVEEKMYNYGEIPEYTGDTPIREEDEGYTYTFSHWYPDFKPVERDYIYVAEFNSAIKHYDIKFKIGDDETSKTYEYNTTPKYEGNLIGDNNLVVINSKKYRFEGWQPEIGKVVKEQTYNAILRECKDRVTVHFEPNCGSVNKDVEIDSFTKITSDISFTRNNHSLNAIFIDGTDVGGTNNVKNYVFYQDSTVIPLYMGSDLAFGTYEFVEVNHFYVYDYRGDFLHFTLPTFDYYKAGCGKCTDISNYPMVRNANNKGRKLTFYVPNYLKSIKGPKPLHTITELDKESTFKSDITNVVVSKNHPNLRDNGSPSIIEKSSNKLITANEYTLLTDDIKEIGENAFSTTLIEKIYMPDSIEKVYKEAFSYCGTLNSVVLSNSLSKLEEGTFKNTRSLNSIWIPTNIKEIGEDCFSGTNSNLVINYEGDPLMWANIVSSDTNLSNFKVNYNVSKPNGE